MLRGTSAGGSDWITAFDVEAEQWRTELVGGPPETFHNCLLVSLAALRGSLVHDHRAGTLDLWFLLAGDGDGGKFGPQHWLKLYTVTMPYHGRPFWLGGEGAEPVVPWCHLRRWKGRELKAAKTAATILSELVDVCVVDVSSGEVVKKVSTGRNDRFLGVLDPASGAVSFIPNWVNHPTNCSFTLGRTATPGGEDWIVAFDLEAEQWQPDLIGGPPAGTTRHPCLYVTLATLRGSLGELEFPQHPSWIRPVTMPYRERLWRLEGESTEVVVVLDDGRVVFWVWDTGFSRATAGDIMRVYDPATGGQMEVAAMGVRPCRRVHGELAYCICVSSDLSSHH
uniref:F-box associated domain-containing protein n=1 Tax=Oryza punctata TaxID=4537 RepID=A0A0E0LIU8_ORYPU